MVFGFKWLHEIKRFHRLSSLKISNENPYRFVNKWEQLKKSGQHIPTEVIEKFLNICIDYHQFIIGDEYALLETGIGLGKIGLPLSHLLNQRGQGHVTGFDISLSSLISLRKQIEKEKLKNLHIVLTDIDYDRFPFKDSTFTGIFISYVLHYAHECKQCLDEILRILKDPGIIVFSKEVSEWVYYLDGHFNTVELQEKIGQVNVDLEQMWQYYYNLRNKISPMQKREISGTQYAPAIDYLKDRNMTVYDIPLSQCPVWHREFSLSDILYIIENGSYSPLYVNLSKMQRKALSNDMKEYAIAKNIHSKKYKIKCLYEGTILVKKGAGTCQKRH